MATTKKEQPFPRTLETRNFDFEALANVQFLPRFGGFRNSWKSKILSSFHSDGENINNYRSHEEDVNTILSSVLVVLKTKRQPEHVKYLRKRSPIGRIDQRSVQILKSLGIPAYHPGGTSLFVMNPNYGKNRTNIIFLMPIQMSRD